MISAYGRERIININVNIILAGMLSAVLSIIPINHLEEISESMLFIVLGSSFIDGFFDFLIFTVLHVYVTKKNMSKKNPSGTLLKDVFRIHRHKGVLAIVFFITATTSQYLLMFNGFPPVVSFFISYMCTLFFTRAIHTIYGIKTGLFKPI